MKVTRKPAKKPSRLPLIAAGSAVLLIGGGAATYLLLGSRNPQGFIPVGVSLVPETALFSLSVSTNANQWQRLRQMGIPAIRSLVNENLEKFNQQLLKERGLDYARDIQPWVGEQITMAELPLSAATVAPNLPADQQHPQLWILPIANPQAAQQAFDRLSAAGGTTLERRTYKGVEIRQTPANSTQPYALAVLNQVYVVISSVPAVVEQAIDTHQGQPSLLQVGRYREALGQIATHEQPFAQMYINIPAATSATGTALAPGATTGTTPTASPPASPSPAGKPGSPELLGFAANMLLQGEQQVRFQSVSWLPPNSAQTAVESRDQELARRLPEGTLMMYSGSNFQQFWQNYSQSNTAPSENPLSPEQIRKSVKSSTNLDFDRDFVSWMNGEFGAAVLPSANKDPKGAGLVFFVRTGNRAGAEKTLQQLDRVVQKQQQWQVGQSQVGNQNVTTWTVPPSLPVATHGWLNQETVFLSLGAPVASTFLPQPQTSLERSQLFASVTRSDLRPGNGQMFINMPEMLKLVDNSPILPKLSPEVRRFAETIQTVGITTANRNNWSTRYDILLELLRSPQS